jgi:hypothetical protein
MTELNKQGRYDRLTKSYILIGFRPVRPPLSAYTVDRTWSCRPFDPGIDGAAKYREINRLGQQCFGAVLRVITALRSTACSNPSAVRALATGPGRAAAQRAGA